LKSTTVNAVFVSALLALGAADLSAAPSSGYGSAGAAANASSWSLEQMLRYAIEDEYFARADGAVMRKFGEARPFSNIKQSEDQHIGWLSEVYAARKLAVPADDAASRVPVPATLLDAYKTGEQAEIDNIAMYNAFLRSPILGRSENRDVRDLFERLMNASENHLRAFRNQLARF